ncbi:phage tail tape measure protein, partial [Mycolicibacterium fortuitum]
MRRDIARALNQATRNAAINPQLNTSGMSSQANRAGRDFGTRFGAAAKTAIAAAGIGVGIAGIASQFKQVMSVGMDWTNNMNTLRAVTGGTADELKKAADAARALGNDISLPATSANDAASAMTELAKGGFTVQQAMDAAKGSLQLAAAAQISATDAATIQSQALQAFGLSASSAGKMSDTLANAANASSAEITDVAQAMQQAGTVANQFGLSAEDTAAAIGLLANNGIKGSDAGTLLKSSLLALTDQGNPAQGAIKELGLTVYDATGKFVGLHSLYGQLGEAAKRMTPEQYQAATAVLFGSDAMRIAGVAAKDGSASYDQMRVAIDKQGAAADVAAAKTQGLPGAWERVKNAIESLQLKAYDALQGPVSGLLDKTSAGLGSLEDSAVRFGANISAAWAKLGSNDFIQSTWTDMLGAFQSLSATGQALLPTLVQVGQSLAKASAALGVSTWKVLVTALEAAAGALNTIAPLIQGVGNFMSSHQGVVTAAVGAWLLFRTVPAVLGRVTGATVPLTQSLSRMGQQITGQTGALVPLRSRLTAIAGDYRNIGTAAQNNGQHLSSFNRLMTAVSNNSPTIRNMG